MKKVGIIMGSDSDLPVVQKAIDTLKDYGVPFEVHVYSAHRTPVEAKEFSSNARANGFGAIIAAAGMAAHLAGAIAANTTLPVIGIPVKSKNFDGMDALLSTVQMPTGIPVATVAVDGAANAALLAIQVLAVADTELADKLDAARAAGAAKVLAVFEFRPVSAKDMLPVLRRAYEKLYSEGEDKKELPEETMLYIASGASGDVRRAVGLLENAYLASENEVITPDDIDALAPKIIGNFDKSGSMHYDLLSALQKSVRGSDPDAAVFYLAKLLEGGDMLSACRRLQQMASEDIGLAWPMAAVLADACVNSALRLGMPEASAPLANLTIALATAPKSISAMDAYTSAKEYVLKGKGADIPAHLREVTKFDGYKYPHAYENHWVKQQYLPNDIRDAVFYTPGKNKSEAAAVAYWDAIKNPKKS